MHRCSYCGKPGHKRPTCPERKNPLGGISPKKLIPQQFEEVFNPGDYVEVNGTGSPYDGRRYEVEFVTSNGLAYMTTGERFYPKDLLRVSSLDVSFTDDDYKEPELDPSVFNSPAPVVQEQGSGIEMSKIDCWELIEAVIPNEKRTLLYGPPGTGKTTAGNFAGTPSMVYNVTLTEETPAAEIRGHYVPRGGEFHWQDGPAMRAYRDGARLILNEIDKASVDCLTFCYALLDDPSISMITLPTGETVKPHENFSCVATTNGVPEDLPDALKDRLAVRIYVPTPHPEAIKSLPEDLQKPATKGFGKPESPSFREWKAYASLREKIGNEFAAKAVWGNRAETVLNTLKIGTKSGKG
jgi:hypothetical protein